MQYSFLFPRVTNDKNAPRETRVIVENNVASFLNHGRFGQDVSAPDVSAYDVSASGRFVIQWANVLIFNTH